MSNYLPKPDLISTEEAIELLRWVNLKSGGNNNERRAAAKIRPVADLAGKVSTEETVLKLEADWEMGRQLSAEETQLLREHEELLDSER